MREEAASGISPEEAELDVALQDILLINIQFNFYQKQISDLFTNMKSLYSTKIRLRSQNSFVSKNEVQR